MSGRKWPADDTNVSVELLGMLLRSLEAELPRGLELRERLHTIPEPSHGEHTTSSLVAESLGTESVESIIHTGLLARVGPPGDAVAVRAELDALPVQEETGSSFASANGFMHASQHCFGPQDGSKHLCLSPLPPSFSRARRLTLRGRISSSEKVCWRKQARS